jgi:hypothetical protein
MTLAKEDAAMIPALLAAADDDAVMRVLNATADAGAANAVGLYKLLQAVTSC